VTRVPWKNGAEKGVDSRQLKVEREGMAGRVRGEWTHPHPGCFWAKSAQSLEKKRVEFFVSAKKCKRVRKNLKRKGID
jgi:hypothetical protein